jgi:hypothetical protein
MFSKSQTEAAVLVIFGLSLPSLSLGCEPPDDLFTAPDPRIEIRADCSFVNQDPGGSSEGFPVRDRGNMKLGQRIINSSWCGPGEELLFVDCSANELVVLQGKPRTDAYENIGGGQFTYVEEIQKPKGPIEITGSSTVSGLIKTAERSGIAYYTDLVTRLGRDKRKNRFDPYCGCKLFYPDSEGATQ